MYKGNQGFSTRPTFDLGYWYDHNDVLRTRSGLFLENVAENGESIRQDIYRYGFYCGADVRPTRSVGVRLRLYTYAHYSDDNDSHNGYFYNEVSLTLPPKQLKLVETANVWSYHNQTVFPTPIPKPIRHARRRPSVLRPGHLCQLRSACREWWHWLSRDYFAHSNQCWYSLQYGIMTDSNLVVFHNLRALLNYDVNSCLSVGVDAHAYLGGDTYTQYQAMAYLQVRFLGK